MSFLNGLLALGTLAFTVPLLIHLLFRNRFRRVQWGAMHLIAEVVRTNRRRLRLTEIILLLIRCAIPIVLALCLARPVINALKSRGENRAMVLVVDDSASMSANLGDGTTPISRAIKTARDMVRGARRGDAIAVVPASKIADGVAGWGGRREAVRQIDALTATGNSRPLGELARGGLAVAETSDRSATDIIILTDAADNVLSADDTLTDAADLADTIQSRSSVSVAVMPMATRDERPAASEAAAQRFNVGVTELKIESPVALRDAAIEFVGRVENRGDRELRDITLRWEPIGGAESNDASGSKSGSDSDSGSASESDSGRLTVPPRSSVRVRHRVKKWSDDWVGMRLAVEVGDDLSIDNQRELAVRVVDGLRAAVVIDKRTGGRSGIDPVPLALSPFAYSGATGSDAILSDVVTPASLGSRLKKHFSGDQRLDLIVLDSSPSALGSTGGRFAAELERFVQTGGGLMVLMPATDASAQTIDARIDPGIDAMLPATADGIRQRDGEGSDQGTNGDSGDMQTVQTVIANGYEAWRNIGDDDGRIRVPIRRRTILKIKPDAETIWRLGDDSPLAARWSRGRGRVVQFGLSSDVDDSRWPLRPVFLPMIQQAALSVASTVANQPVPVGRGVALETRLIRGDNAMGVSESEQDSTETRYVISGAADRRTVTAAGGTIELTPDRPGLIRIQGESKTNARESANASKARGGEDQNGSDGPSQTYYLAAVLDADETNLDPPSTQRLSDVADAMGIELVGSLDEFSAAQSIRRDGREIWRYLWMLLMLLLVGELIWQQWRVGRRGKVDAGSHTGGGNTSGDNTGGGESSGGDVSGRDITGRDITGGNIRGDRTVAAGAW